MRLVAALLMTALTFAPIPALAHGDRPQAVHGGDIQDADEFWVELVVKASDVTVYVLSEDHKAISAQQISGTATVLIGGKSYKVELSPGEANSVQGKLPVPATGRLVATVALKVGGKPASARFMGAA